jgi:cell division protein FtsW
MHKTARTFLLLVVASLLVFGISMLYSTTYVSAGETILARQLTWVGLGAVAAVMVWLCDHRFLGRWAWLALILVTLALGYLVFAYLLHKLPFVPDGLVRHLPLIGGPTKGSFRWLRFGPVALQPSEFAKPVLILFLADYFSRSSRYIHEFRRGFLIPMAVGVGVIALILLGKNLSIAVITGVVVAALAFVAGVRVRYLAALVVLGLVALALLIKADPERWRRVTVYRNPEKYQEGEGYQLWTSQLAMGSGGVRGLGFTNSRMKQFYLPEAHTDFIVAIVGEELGFLAVGLLIVAYGLLMAAAFWIAALAPDRQGILLCVGLGLSLGLHAFVNIGVVSGFGPTTGVTAPFLSYGGSSMMNSLICIGLLLSVSRTSEREQVQRDLANGGMARYGPQAAVEA